MNTIIEHPAIQAERAAIERERALVLANEREHRKQREHDHTRH